MSGNLGSVKSFGYSKAETITVKKTLTYGDIGKVFYLDSAGGAYTITLPTLRAGAHFKFIAQENTPTADITISSSTTDIYGVLRQQSDTNEDNMIACAGKTSVLFDTTCLKGDFLEITCDGTNWYVDGDTSVQGGFTTA